MHIFVWYIQARNRSNQCSANFKSRCCAAKDMNGVRVSAPRSLCSWQLNGRNWSATWGQNIRSSCRESQLWNRWDWTDSCLTWPKGWRAPLGSRKGDTCLPRYGSEYSIQILVTLNTIQYHSTRWKWLQRPWLTLGCPNQAWAQSPGISSGMWVPIGLTKRIARRC